jgi:hypothetical protein
MSKLMNEGKDLGCFRIGAIYENNGSILVRQCKTAKLCWIKSSVRITSDNPACRLTLHVNIDEAKKLTCKERKE